MAGEISRQDYAARYGPTAGDRIRLGDTNLLALIECDETSYGDEVLRGWGGLAGGGLLRRRPVHGVIPLCPRPRSPS